MKKYFFIDYDNTLFSHRTNRIPDSAMEAVLSAQKAGHRVCLASGRGFRGDISEFVGPDFKPDGLVSSNGALLEAEGKLLKEKYFDPEIKKRLLDFVAEKNYCLISCCENRWYVSNPERMYAHRTKAAPPLPGPIISGQEFSLLLEKPVLSFFLEEEEEALADLEQHFPELKVLRMSEDLGGADIVPKENGKASGMLQILDYFGASPKDAVAIGDSMNDLEILQYAGLGIAMGNAMSQLKTAAGYVTADIDDDGLKLAFDYALSLAGS